MSKLASILFFLAIAMHISLAQSANDKALAAAEQKLDELWKDAKAPGVSLSIVLPDGTAKTLTRGLSNVEKQIAMSAKTRMPGGSNGKVFYSVVAMQLIEEGKLKLDEPIEGIMKDYDWFEKIPNAKDLTVRSLMRHETGIPRYVFGDTFQKELLVDVDRFWKPEELLAYVFDSEPQFEVGTDFAYADTNYIILCMLIEKVTGNSLYKEVQRRVLKRAGLKDVIPQVSRKYKHVAQGYNDENNSFFPGKQFDNKGKSRYNLQFEWGGGGLVITTRDLAVLGKKIYEGEMFDPSLLDEYFNSVSAGRLGGEWGLGVHIRDTSVGKVYGHSGFMPGYVTNMLYYAEGKFSICYQLNTSDRSRTSIMRELPTIGIAIIKSLER